ncbi:Ganglioside GM2 activator [Bulinus truncatus]|nr:Ganglioside GM2 activator [Bulinus truncatus]
MGSQVSEKIPFSLKAFVVVTCVIFAQCSSLSLIPEDAYNYMWLQKIETIKRRIADFRNKFQPHKVLKYSDGPLANRMSRFNTLSQEHTLENCGDPSDTFVINGMWLHPDPIPTQGDLFFTVHFTVTEDITDPLKIVVYTERQELNNWLPLGCHGYWGSCEFENVCAMLDKMMTCPSQLMRKIPCKCPFKKGYYEINNSKLRLNLKDYAIVVYTERQELNNWLPLGCHGYWGSCEFENVCAMLDKMMTCPSQLMRKIPCKCPFKKGYYEINNSKLRLNLKDYAVGTYRTTIQMFHYERKISCYRLIYSIKKY